MFATVRSSLRYIFATAVMGSCLLASCSQEKKETYGYAGTAVRYDTSAGSFYSLPYPNDLRLDAETKTIRLDDFPNPKGNTMVAQILALASAQHSGFGLLPVASFAFDGPVDTAALPLDLETPPTEPYQLFFLNLDPESPRYGERIAAVARFFDEEGPYNPENLLTMAPWPGLSLAPGATYAAIVLRTLHDAGGKPLGQAATLAKALAGVPDGHGLAQLFRPLRLYLSERSDLKASQIAAATVFTTGDPAGEMKALVDEARETYAATVAQAFTLAHNETDFCYFEGRVTLPQFQNGTAPYPDAGEGQVQRDAAGKLVKQRDEAVKIVLTVPTGTMPAHGFPVVQYTHGSGGVADEMISRGKVTVPEGPEEPWRGPAYHAATRGFAAVGQAMPISPDRVPNAASFDYLQLTNLTSMAGNFQQGTIEMALLRDLIDSLSLPASVCPGLDTGGNPITFDSGLHVAMGQSMGAMYTNLFGAISTDTAALIPTGSGGYWSFFLFGSEIVPDAENVLKVFLGVTGTAPLDHLHPLLGLFQQYAEAVDPVVFIPRLVREPLPEVPAKHVYVPHGYEDKYFNRRTQRAMALGYGFPLAGDLIDTGMESQLALFRELDPVSYPVAGSLTAGDGREVTAMQAQFPEDDIQQNGHTVYAQRDEVIYQYGCFLESLRRDGMPTVPAPVAEVPGPACP